MPESGRKDSIPIPGIHDLLENTASLVGGGGRGYIGTETDRLPRKTAAQLEAEAETEKTSRAKIKSP